LSQYLDGLTKKNYVPNVVVLFAGEHFCIRPPDSGLVTDSRYDQLLSRVSVSPTSIDPLRPTTTINTSSFSLVDKGSEVSKLFLNETGFRMGEPVEMWIGRSFESMDFSEYLKVPAASIKSFAKLEGSYNFSVVEVKDRLNTGIFNIQTKLAVSILVSTTTITLQAIPTGLPLSGYVKINDEFVSFAGRSGNNLTGCARGEFGSTPADHESGSDVYNTWDISARNGIDFLLQILMSDGGGGAYDVLPEGLGFDSSLVDVDQFEEIRDEFFTSRNLSFRIWGIQSLQKFIEDEIYNPMGVRLRANNNGKIGLAVLNRNIFVIDAPILNESNILKMPTFSISDDKIVNRVRILWNWSDGRNLFLDTYEQEDATSIAEYGSTPFTQLSFKGVKTLAFVQSIANLFLSRFSTPRADISVDVLNNASYLLVGDKTELYSSQLPTDDGTLDFVSTLEVLKKSYDVGRGVVKYALSFTAFSGIKQCFISPSDLIVSHSSQKVVTLSSGRGLHYRIGWIMRHYDNNARDYADAQTNEIVSIVGDVLTFKDDWTTTLTDSVSRIVFADHDQVIEAQKKFCFINSNNDNFDNGDKPYQITFS
jgi:hypothetical protein